MKNYRLAMVTTMILGTSACQSGMEQAGSPETVPVRNVYISQQCYGDAAGIEPIREAQALADWWQPISRRQLPAKPLPQSLGTIRFNESDVFVISMGRQTSSGYGIELYENRALMELGTLTIPANFTKPPPGMMTAQVMSRPCIVVAVPSNPYQAVIVLDQRGNTLLEHRL